MIEDVERNYGVVVRGGEEGWVIVDAKVVL